ncbi:3548_t:CDS:2 [Cetraspora pellucida]|uniref:3548_t:CDS:1 n=1 Tax=Cetraspora pellucida TaxID=1433469 RepID=A0ACA9KVH9_9GLOM|nr:3548_t:CDS:2 [Cetraspora pellucida]
MWENVLNDLTPGDSDHDFGSMNRGNTQEDSKPPSNESLLDNPNPLMDHEQQPTPDQQTIQLLQLLANALKLSQEPQVELGERNVVNYPMFSGRNQDPMEWIESITRAFNANNIQEARRIIIASAHLSDLAALWWESLRNQGIEIRYWNNETMLGQSFEPVPRINQGTNVRSVTSSRPITSPYVTTQAPISPLHRPMYPINQPVTSAQPPNASIEQVMALLREVAMAEAYMAKRKRVDEEPAEVEPSSGNSRSDGDI